MKVCVECGRFFVPDGDELHVKSVKLCDDCFEGALEQHEEMKRQRIARENEY